MHFGNLITVAHGDGIGPEIMDATLRILDAAGAGLEYDHIAIGEQVYKSGHLSGIEPSAWDSIRNNKIFLKAPITTPQGGGYKSLNVTIRKSLGLYANVRPCKSYAPYVTTNHPEMDMIIVRENEEDLYAGIEHQQTEEVVQCLKLISRPGCERIVRYAFEYARAYGRKKVTCMTKDNIMKHTDGMFHDIFREVAKEYTELESEHRIIDIGSAIVASSPGDLDVVVTLNLYGDIISDIAAQVSGSVGLAGSANIGTAHAMFEAIHGSAPDIAGQDIANPCGLIGGAIMMLQHLGKAEIAEKIQNARLKTLEDGIHTGDIYQEGFSKQKVGTKAFADALIERLGQRPEHLAQANYSSFDDTPIQIKLPKPETKAKALVGIDVFIDWTGTNRNPDELGQQLEASAGEDFKLKMITNRGVKVYPDGLPETFCTDHWRCRFVGQNGGLDHASVVGLLQRISAANLDFIKTEHLYTFNGERAYSLGQGE